MPDIVDRATRARMMAGIKGKDTTPELVIRKALFARGYRYRLHNKKLPGRPDLVFPGRKSVIFINGCFWHMHDCYLFKWPSTRQEFWRAKIRANAERDTRNIQLLEQQGWRWLRVWECAIKGKMRRPIQDIVDQVANWLNDKADA